MLGTLLLVNSPDSRRLDGATGATLTTPTTRSVTTGPAPPAPVTTDTRASTANAGDGRASSTTTDQRTAKSGT